MQQVYTTSPRSFFFQYRELMLSFILLVTALTCFPGAGNATGSSFAEGVFASAPVLSAESYRFTVSETAAVGTAVGSIRASDPDGDAIRYTITAGNTNKAFTLNATTGAITVAKKLGYHTQSSYSLSVRATDTGGLYDAATVAITVTAGLGVPAFSTISWSTAASQPYGTHEVHGEVVKGKLYVFGGYDVLKRPSWTPTKRAHVYDPATNSWKAIAELPHTPKGTDFGGVTHFGLTTDGTDIYFAGGYTSNTSGTGQLFGTRQVWRYNVASNTYTALPSLPVELAAGQMRYLRGRLHYIGGANLSRQDIASHYVLDLDNLAAGWKTLAPLSNPRNHPGSAVYEGKIYFIGGARGQDDATVTQRTMEVYNPATNTWTRAADLPNGLDHISSSVVVMGTRILVVGGETSHNVRTNAVLAYTPATNTWARLTNLPVSSAAGVAAVLNNTLYYTGGNFSRTTYKGTPGGTSTSQKLVSFTLINADNEQAIQTLASGSTLNLATLPTRNLNIRANTSPTTVGSVVFNLSGAQTKTVTESRAPYALFGDNNYGDYYAWTPVVGSYTLKGTPYSASGGGGTAGTSLTVSFTVTNQTTTSALVSLDEPTAHSIKVYPNPGSGNDVFVRIENFARQETVAVSLYDLLGRVIRTTDVITNETGDGGAALLAGIPIARGAYFIKATARSGKAQTKLLIR